MQHEVTASDCTSMHCIEVQCDITDKLGDRLPETEKSYRIFRSLYLTVLRRHENCYIPISSFFGDEIPRRDVTVEVSWAS